MTPNIVSEEAALDLIYRQLSGELVTNLRPSPSAEYTLRKIGYLTGLNLLSGFVPRDIHLANLYQYLTNSEWQGPKEKHLILGNLIDYLSESALDIAKSFGNLVLAIDAREITNIADGGVISQWDDLSGAGNHLVQATASMKPTWQAASSLLNNKPAVRFDGVANTGDHLRCPRLFSDDLFTIYALVNGVAQVNKAIASQHNGAASVGRTVFMASANDGVGAKVDLFFNNGSSFTIRGTSTGFDNKPHLVRTKSNGIGFQAVGIDNSADEGTSSGQTWTPINLEFSVGAAWTTITSTFSEWAGDMGALYAFRSYLTEAQAFKLQHAILRQWGL